MADSSRNEPTRNDPSVAPPSVYLIRLRKAWSLKYLESTDLGLDPARVDLPLALAELNRIIGKTRLSRSVGRPRLDSASETLALRLEHVPGLFAVRMDGHSIPLPGLIPESFDLPIRGKLGPRFHLELDVDLGIERADSEAEDLARLEGWGQISIVIGSTDRLADGEN